jgi:hypothetical protein
MWTRSCPFADEPVVPLVLTGDPARFHPVLDIPQGIGFAEYVAIVTSIVDSMHLPADVFPNCQESVHSSR